jgi:hypothetical protein
MTVLKVLFAALLTATLCCAVGAPDCSLVPGWGQQGPARTYVADNLFDYMNGNAEGYLIYQFVRMQGVTCMSSDISILIDVSEMADAESAYGIFTANRDPRRPTQKIGMGGQIRPRRATFVKDKYYVELAANPEGDHTAALRAFVDAMEKRIPGQTELPVTIGWFPTEKLVRDSIRLIPQSVLGMRQLKRGYVAEYEYGKAFIVAETSTEGAASVMNKVRERLGQTEPAGIADEGFQASSRYLGRLCFFRKGRYIGGFADLSKTEDAMALAIALAARIP